MSLFTILVCNSNLSRLEFENTPAKKITLKQYFERNLNQPLFGDNSCLTSYFAPIFDLNTALFLEKFDCTLNKDWCYRCRLSIQNFRIVMPFSLRYCLHDIYVAVAFITFGKVIAALNRNFMCNHCLCSFLN